MLYYDVTALHFESDNGDELRKCGISKDGRHKNPQIIPGLPVIIDCYPLAYCIHERNKYEGRTMLPEVTEFVKKYSLDDFIAVADSGLVNHDNLADLEADGYKYIVGAKIKNESKEIKECILKRPKQDCQMIEYEKDGGQEAFGGLNRRNGTKNACNRDKVIRRLEKAYKRGALTKDNINKRGYNKFLRKEGEVPVSVNYDKLDAGAQWDGLKGCLTNTDIPVSGAYTAYHNLWQE